MKSISKPHIVDLLRIFDQRKWIHPRIRYASVRSKGELLEDHFRTFVHQGRVTFVPKKGQCPLPKIEYDLKKRVYLLDGQPQDFPRESRQKPKFSILKGPITLTFPAWSDLRATRKDSVSSSESQELGTRDRPSCSQRTGPFPRSV